MADAHDLSGLMEFAGSPRWRAYFEDALSDHLGPALSEFDVGFDDLPDAIGDHGFGIVWGCAFEDLLTRPVGPKGRTIVEDYLKGRGRGEGRANAAYMRALTASAFSLHEVSDVRPGESMLLRDLVLGGEPVRVSERSATRTLRAWDVIAARVIELDGIRVMSGGTLSYTPDATQMFLDGLRHAMIGTDGEGEGKANGGVAGNPDTDELEADVRVAPDVEWDGPSMDADTLRPLAPLVTSAWLFDVVPRAMGLMPPPVLRNTDGDEVVFHHMRFPFQRGTTQAIVAERLDALPELERAGPKFWNWLDREPERGSAGNGRADPALPSERSLQWNVTMDDGSAVLGNVELKGRALILSVSSAERAERGGTMLRTALDGLIGPPSTEIETIDQAMRARAEERGDRPGDDPRDSTSTFEADVPPEIAAPFVHDMLERHYRAVLDQPVAALGDVTPREAVRTRPGRKRAAAWLKQLENGTGRHMDPRANPDDAMASYDFGWMWKELGIERLRR